MKTTNKEFKVLVQAHILDCMGGNYGTNPTEELQNVVEAFENWYSPYEQKRTPNKQDAFIEFLNGLPSELSVEYSSFMICETLKYWFTHVGMEFKERHAHQEATTYYHLIYREFCTLCKQYNVKF